MTRPPAIAARGPRAMARSRMPAIVMTLAVALAPSGSRAADLVPGVVPAAPVLVDPGLCLTGAPITYRRAPGEMMAGEIPAGTLVAFRHPPLDRAAHLWVQLEAPASDMVYGWVYTRHLICH